MSNQHAGDTMNGRYELGHDEIQRASYAKIVDTQTGKVLASGLGDVAWKLHPIVDELNKLQAAIEAVRPLVHAERRQLSSEQLAAWEAGE